MNRYSRPGFVGGASSSNRASATTVCQKCLKKGHYSYDCKAQAQERPYISRPSRSQQLLNPKLKPKLTNIAPTPTDQEKSSTAHVPAKERSHKRSLDNMDDHRPSRKRTRSVSSFSSDSVSTISTRSPSPDRSRNRHDARQDQAASATEGAGDKRGRPSSSASDQIQSHDIQGRNTRMRRNSRSPSERGRRRGRSANSERRMRSASDHKITVTDAPIRRLEYDGQSMLGHHNDVRADYNHNHNNNARDQDREMKDVPGSGERPRSLSPFSKRVALTQGMNR
ncbi:hypothetical protein AUEXF2481DRAFT_135998 [Aureobasidium subglaciale EXF-2481]|uniref:Uncharacterized protein n=1 Tax=Aureobasidium subglaciale (strain EXF-2481) TaxID=1043005 RepID=A0A074YRQ7_AURSE|nr:uncharacterized protein AUEXF2481DRAFT_135998 [Aureobasidium subglaciale EXF-2481]KER00434.1 hypothetical protein AUEXF2481DRAFT_135998 [Aureobasidium subglaciale EXF-2481]